MGAAQIIVLCALCFAAGFAGGILVRQVAVVDRLTADLERTRVQLAGCGVAALGYAVGKNECRPGDYGWSASLGDVLRLRERFDRLQRALNRLVFVARTSGGTAGADDALMAACDSAERALQPESSTTKTQRVA